MNNKILIYQVFTRLYGNRNTTRKEWGTLEENGSGKFNDFTPQVLKDIKAMGISHIWFTGVIRHATQTDYSEYGIPTQHPAVVKGRAGSPYAICDYYDVDPDLAVDVKNRMKEFEALIARTHKAGMKVIMDFVPNHVARQYQSIAKPKGVKDLGAEDNVNEGFNPQNNFYYCPGQRFDPYFDLRTSNGGLTTDLMPYVEEPAKSTGNDHFDANPGINDWYETVKLNYGVDYWTHYGHFDPIPDTWKKMTAILQFWASKGVDGFRCDMAEMVPAAFWAWATDNVKFQHPDILFIGEVYNPDEYRNYIAAGFDYLYDKVGMYDTMRNTICGHGSASFITGAWQSTDDISQHMLYFLENHDEQRVASDDFAGSAERGIPGLVASVLMRENPFMLYAAEEYGERGMEKEGFSGKDGRTTIFDYWSIDTLCRAAEGQLTAEEEHIYSIHQRVLQIARKEKAVDGAFYDLMYANPWSARFDNNKQFAFLRKKDGDILLVVCNFNGNAVNIDVKIPPHAVEFLEIPEKKYNATDLLTGDKKTINIKGGYSVDMDIPAYSARIWKLSYRKK
ncbi:MAG: alpha amylase C-terminal domain-containing protein [Prevotella sp.]|nr:alpha amylase C-terminal domain-containing protein [Prevotella sp.]